MSKFIKELYPTTKVWLILGLIVCTVFTPGYLFQYSLFGVAVVLALCSGILPKFLSLFFKSIFIICLFIFVIQIFFVYHDHIIWQWGWLRLSNTGLQTSYLMTSKIVAIGALLIWFFQVTEVKAIAAAMQNAGWNKKLVFVILSTMQLIPQITALTATIADAQKSRGVETEGSMWQRIKSFIPMLGPVVLTSIEQNEERVLTLESRAFASHLRPTLMIPVKKTRVDRILSVIFVLGAIGLFYWRVFK